MKSLLAVALILATTSSVFAAEKVSGRAILKVQGRDSWVEVFHTAIKEVGNKITGFTDLSQPGMVNLTEVNDSYNGVFGYPVSLSSVSKPSKTLNSYIVLTSGQVNGSRLSFTSTISTPKKGTSLRLDFKGTIRKNEVVQMSITDEEIDLQVVFGGGVHMWKIADGVYDGYGYFPGGNPENLSNKMRLVTTGSLKDLKKDPALITAFFENIINENSY